MNIAFVSTYNARNVSNWSGLGYYISKALEDNGNNLKFIGELTGHVTIGNFLKKVYFTKIRNKKFALERTVTMAQGYATQVSARLSNEKYDCIFSPGSLPLAYLKTDLPKVIFTDATFACMLNYYEPAGLWSSDMIRQGHEIEKHALDTCALAIYSSEWAAQSAVDYYGTDPSKVKVVPFGANLDKEYSESEVREFIFKKDNKTLKILFNGVDFLRKGGDLVVLAAKELQKRGIKVELHFVGLHTLPVDDTHDFIINHGYLKKAIPEQRNLLEQLYETCHFLFLPSKAEAFGCVFCEASSFGMPSISRKTGGVPTAIRNGINGFALDPLATVDNYVDLISSYFVDKQKYVDLSLSSFQEYKTRLNWKVAGESLTKLIEQL